MGSATSGSHEQAALQYVLVPMEPTEEMQNAGRHEIAFVADCGSFAIMATASYRAMIAARPALTEPCHICGEPLNSLGREYCSAAHGDYIADRPKSAPTEPVALGKLAEEAWKQWTPERPNNFDGCLNHKDVFIAGYSTALANTEAQMRELEQWRQLATDPAAVRVNLLRGTLAKPDDLIFMHDTNGPYAALEAQMRGMRERIAEQDRVMELLYTQAAEGNDHVGQLHDKIGSLQAMVSELEKALALSREQHAM